MTEPIIEKVKVFALGGVCESGNNMYVIEIADDIIVMDAGSMGPEKGMPGIDAVIPDIRYLTENAERVRGIFLTHGHEGHIGALPYILDRLNVPVYGTALTIRLVINRLEDEGLADLVKLRTIDPGKDVKAGKVRISFFRTDHSIYDSIGICIHTKQGAVVYTGDFKFQLKNGEMPPADLQTIAEIGSHGVLCLLSESQNAQMPGFSKSEVEWLDFAEEAFIRAGGRIIIIGDAIHFYRLQSLLLLARDYGCRVEVSGYDLKKALQAVTNLGYLHDVNEFPGSQKEIVNDEHNLVVLISFNMYHNGPFPAIKSGDTVIIADGPLPGYEKQYFCMIEKLERGGAEVLYEKHARGVYGHAHAEELKLMLAMMKPKVFLPVDGEYQMLRAHRLLAEAIGIPSEQIFVAEKGEVVEMVNGEAQWGGKVPSGKTLVDGSGIGEIGNVVLRDRKLLASDGILLVVAALNRRTKQILSGPEIHSRGFVHVRNSEKLLAEATRIAREVLKDTFAAKEGKRTPVKAAIRDSLGRYFFSRLKRNPMILPIIMEV